MTATILFCAVFAAWVAESALGDILAAWGDRWTGWAGKVGVGPRADGAGGPYRTPGREPDPPAPDPDMPTHPNEPGGRS